MIKTKKEILVENLTIDLTNEFNPLEIKVLKKFYQIYGLEGEFDIFEAAALLIEEMELDYQTAYDLVNTFYFNRRILFREHESLKHKTSKTELFFKYLNEFIDKIIKEQADVRTIIINTLDGPEERELNVWDLYYAISLYISYDITTQINSGLTWEEFGELNKKNNIRVNVDFNRVYEKESTYKYDDEKFSLTLSYKIGDGERIIVDTFEIPYPEKITKESMAKIVSDALNMVKNFAEQNKFNVNKLSDSQ